MSYQPFSRADRKRWRRGERPRASLWMREWWSARFEAWAVHNPSPGWRRIPIVVGKAGAFCSPMTAHRVGAP